MSGEGGMGGDGDMGRDGDIAGDGDICCCVNGVGDVERSASLDDVCLSTRTL
jgi:hypothetical protein